MAIMKSKSIGEINNKPIEAETTSNARLKNGVLYAISVDSLGVDALFANGLIFFRIRILLMMVSKLVGLK